MNTCYGYVAVILDNILVVNIFIHDAMVTYLEECRERTEKHHRCTESNWQ